MKILARIKSFYKNEQGAEIAEYAVAAALVVAIAVVVYQVIGDAILDRNTGTAADIQNATYTKPAA